MIKSILYCTLTVFSAFAAHGAKPNIVFVITDDQGYGDLSCHGNPILKTPNLDKLHSESLRLTDYHVSPTCTPTRAALMTGRYTNRTGAWHTIMGRSLLRTNETTVADYLSKAGYVTGIFGKWHLGDSYPYQPEYRGFQKTYIHGGGGIGQTPDLWDNSYFDDTYIEDGELVKAKGFCTDVFFDEAIEFIEEQHEAKKPFFAYISTNAPHGPFHAPQKYIDMYAGQKGDLAPFFGMIANIDDNVGKLRTKLAEIGADKNTLFIFTTDNGTVRGGNVFNAGMSGGKGKNTEGGHRVPFFMHWPENGWTKGRDIKQLSAHIDVLPTLSEICDFEIDGKLPVDGLSLVPLLKEENVSDWKDRVIVTDSQRIVDPRKWKDSSTMIQDWRLLNGKKLYQLSTDPGQKKDIADKHPERVKMMREGYEAWWDSMVDSFAEGAPYHLGDNPKPLELTAHDLVGTGGTASVAWNQGHIRKGTLTGVNKDGAAYWQLKVTKAGEYTFKLSRYPLATGLALNAAAPVGKQVPGTTKAFRTTPARAIDISAGKILLNGKEITAGKADPTKSFMTLTASLPEGTHQLSALFDTPDGPHTAYFLNIEAKK